ncbi:GlcG/HbpS family heme-binding protein [Halomarina pelagica]|uniref:GlcG/HbpS family heme-binding protein n=1 Tax=Halomarina pelagica TaxID=2961599 RepID=UPI0020C20CA4|nr:heme-binding protein [Halomarina sp. BND7]
MNLSTATAAIDAAVDKAEEIEVPMCVAVVDDGGNLVAFRRMDDALLASVDIAQDKAYSALSLQMPTADLAEVARPGESLFGIHTTNDGRIVVFGGGVPLRSDGELVGAIGVSGGSVEEDVTVAEAGVDAFDS